MFRFFSFFIFTLFSFSALPFGLTGHRVVAKIATENLSAKASSEVKKILGDETLEMVVNLPDFRRSDPYYAFSFPWHYVSIDDPKAGYEKSKKNPKGDVIFAINHFIKELKKSNLSQNKKREAILFLAHFVGDIHQPLHVGYTNDQGGNSIKLYWFGKSVNLHEIWDEILIDMQKLSYTEYVSFLNKTFKEEISTFKNDDVISWANESMAMRELVYSYPKKTYKNWEYEYNYKVINELNKRMMQAGIRLAYLLNEIYK